MLSFRTLVAIVCLLLALSCGRDDAPRPLRPLPLLVVHVERPPAPIPQEVLPPPPPPPPQDGRAAFARAEQGADERYDADFPYYGVAFHLLAQVFQEPRTDAPIFGYMRRGSRFRAGPPVRGSGCAGRFYPVEGGGYVCDRRGFILGKTLKSFSPAPQPADLHASLPYVYAKTLSDGVPQYYRLPTEAEEKAASAAVAELRRLQAEAATLRAEGAETDLTAGVDAGADGGVAEQFDVLPDYVRMAMRPGFYVSLDGVESAPSGKEFARTVRGAYVELAKLKEATPSPYHGQLLHDGLPRALGLVHFAEAKTMVRDVDQGRFVPGPGLPRFSSLWLNGDKITVGRLTYLGTDAGTYVDARAVRVARTQARPQLVPKNGRWIDVDLDQQTLVAYEGDTPVFATLVATGKPGFDTPTGLFRIHAKHVSTTMDGADGTDEMYSIEDVPWTMYFQGSLALHGAFWHDRFGRVRSHGCVNLSPGDARHLFEWATPVAPPGFHGVNTDLRKHGTYVNVHAS